MENINVFEPYKKYTRCCECLHISEKLSPIDFVCGECGAMNYKTIIGRWEVKKQSTGWPLFRINTQRVKFHLKEM